MSDKRTHPHFKITWEHIDDPNADKILRQVIELILRDGPEPSPPADIDKDLAIDLNEGIPSENINHQT